jgi:DNA-binding PadR family transcriptional regulator
VLCLLYGGPLHPYRMQRLLKEWGKDQVINVGQRSSLYKTIGRLTESGLIAVRQTERDQQYPERTVYELTPEGRAYALKWLAEMLADHRNEFPTFPAALSFAMLLGPSGLLSALRERWESLSAAVSELRATLTEHASTVPRIALLETEYQLAVTQAELHWVKQITDELASGSLTWSDQDFAGAEAAYLADA